MLNTLNNYNSFNKMVKVNGQKIKIYKLDTIRTFNKRVANKLKTTEDFLYYKEKLSIEDIFNKHTDIKVINLLDIIKDNAINNLQVTDLINDIRSKIGNIKFDKSRDIIKIWLNYNTALTNSVSKNGTYVLDIIGNDLKENNIYLAANEIKIAWRERENFVKNLDMKIKENNINIENSIATIKQYENIEEGVISTDFSIESVDYKVIAKSVDDTTLLDLFNGIKLSEYIPFCVTKNFYKIKKDFIPSEKWDKHDDNCITMYVYYKENITDVYNESDHLKIILKYDNDLKDIIMLFNIDKSKNQKLDIITKRILEVINHEMDRVEIQKSIENNLSGLYYLPALRFNKYIFSDLVMNDSIFSSLIGVDEHEKASKQRSGLYIHFYHPITGVIKCTIIQKILSYKDKGMDKDLFMEGDPYIRVKIINASNLKSVKKFQKMLGKLFTYYDSKKEDIIEYYKMYIPDFGNIYEIDEDDYKRGKETLSDLSPELFISGYKTYCSPARQLTNISEKNAIEAISDGKSVLKFPRDIPTDNNSKFPMDGVNQKYYTCNNKEHKFVGLQKNKLPNSGKFPYVPCCFKTDQTNKKIYRHYFEGIELDKTIYNKQNIIITDKILDNNQFGTLPSNIERLFTILDSDTKYEYVRKGVYKNTNSFIQVVMEAMNEETEILDIDGEDAIVEAIKEKRLSFLNKNIIPLCKQELYDMNTQQIINMIKKPDTYFDPKLFIHILEECLNCNIIIFTKNGVNGEMILPRHTQAYYKHSNKKPYIYVYEHMGSYSNFSKYPQCELIVKYNTKEAVNNVKYLFTHKESLKICKVYNMINSSYILNTSLKYTNIKFNKDTKLKSQYIDSYGKTRILNIKYKNKNITLLTDPLQPFRIKECGINTTYLSSIDIINDFINDTESQIISQKVSDNYITHINILLSNNNISIPIEKNTSIIDDVKIDKDTYNNINTDESKLALYTKNKKIALLLKEYTMWMYSKFLHKNKIISENHLEHFSTNFFTIKPDYNYVTLTKIFSKKRSSFIQNNKIVVRNEETIKRLIFLLRINLENNYEELYNYHNKKYIDNYYNNINDFTKYENQVILYGEDSISKILYENKYAYYLSNKIRIGYNKPYFFKNKLVDNNVYLAQKVDNIEKAINISVVWNDYSYNPGIYSENMSIIKFTLFSYINQNNIKKNIVKGQDNEYNIKILAYKINNQPEYIALLSLY